MQNSSPSNIPLGVAVPKYMLVEEVYMMQEKKKIEEEIKSLQDKLNSLEKSLNKKTSQFPAIFALLFLAAADLAAYLIPDVQFALIVFVGFIVLAQLSVDFLTHRHKPIWSAGLRLLALASFLALKYKVIAPHI